MQKDRKKKKITGGGELTINGGAFSLSVGNILGKDSGVAAQEEKETLLKEEKREAQAAAGSVDAAIQRLSKITLHRRSSGKGGKTVTEITLSKEIPVDLEALAKELRKGLGCGSRVEEGKVVLQGDIQDRAGDWLAKKGAKRVVFGN